MNDRSPAAKRDGAFLPIPHPMLRGKLISRYKRFFADLELDADQDSNSCGKVVTAHCPNTGSMKTCGEPGNFIWVSHNPDPKRKLHYTWEYTELSSGAGLVGVNTARPNAIVESALKAGIIPELSQYTEFKREVKYGENSRIDILATDPSHSKKCYIEVKNATLFFDGGIVFPDAVTERGLKHLKELEEMVKLGHDAVAFFLVNRPDGDAFAPASHIDPKWAAELGRAVECGVRVLAYRSQNFIDGARLGDRLKFG